MGPTDADRPWVRKRRTPAADALECARCRRCRSAGFGCSTFRVAQRRGPRVWRLSSRPAKPRVARAQSAGHRRSADPSERVGRVVGRNARRRRACRRPDRARAAGAAARDRRAARAANPRLSQSGLLAVLTREPADRAGRARRDGLAGWTGGRGDDEPEGRVLRCASRRCAHRPDARMAPAGLASGAEDPGSDAGGKRRHCAGAGARSSRGAGLAGDPPTADRPNEKSRPQSATAVHRASAIGRSGRTRSIL